MRLELALLIPAAVAAFFAWAGIHELSHYLACRITAGVRWARFRLYPHYDRGTFFWAAVYLSPLRALSPRERSFFYSAPRILDTIACAVFATAPLWLTGWRLYAASFLAGGGVLDLVVGSLGLSADSDLQRAARATRASPMAMHVAGYALSGISIIGWLYWGGAVYVVEVLGLN